MPQPTYESLNDPERVLARMKARRLDHASGTPHVQVGCDLLEKLIADHDKMNRLRAAGFDVADDGDPYEVTA